MLHLCVDTLKKKIASVLAPTYGAKYFIEEFKEASTNLLSTQPTTRQCFTVKEKIRDSCKWYRNHINSSSVYNVINKIETKDFPQFNWPFSIKKPQFNRRIHNASSTSYLPS